MVTRGFSLSALALLTCVSGVQGLRALEQPQASRPSGSLKEDLVLTPYKKPKSRGPDDDNIQAGRTDVSKQTANWFENFMEWLGYPAAVNDFEQMKGGEGELVYSKYRVEADPKLASHPTMNSHDITATYLYTRDFYQPMNAALRNPEGKVKAPYCEEDKDHLGKKCMRDADWIKDMNIVTEVGLQKLRPWTGDQGALYRGTSLPAFISEALVEGYIFSDKAFMSTTADLKVASEGIEQPDGSKSKVDYLFKFQCEKNTPNCVFNARAVDKISKFEEEKEVVVLPNTPFIVDKVVKGKDGEPTYVEAHPGIR